MHKNIFAILTADETVAFGVVEPLYCSLFCHVGTRLPFNRFTLERFGGTEGKLLAVEARTAHDRFGLTHSLSYAPCALLATRVDVRYAMVMTSLVLMFREIMRSANSAHVSTRREACSIRRAAAERNSWTSARSSSDVGLVCALAFRNQPGSACFLAETIPDTIY